MHGKNIIIFYSSFPCLEDRSSDSRGSSLKSNSKENHRLSRVLLRYLKGIRSRIYHPHIGATSLDLF
ncbi:hypothetical protein ES703_122125 [subsurface metagenome]